MPILDELLNEFKNPPAEYRSVLFWSWNDALDPDEISRQIFDMKEKGLGGFFMHSRDGLETPYMGEKWMECVKRAVETAKDTGMAAWIYDEDRWPSGSGGGLVIKIGQDDFRAKGLTIEIMTEAFSHDELILAVFSAVIDRERVFECKRLELRDTYCPERDEVLIVFRKEVAVPHRNFNDESPIDTFNSDAIKTFIDVAYEPYKKEIGHEFGNTVPGAFTDEPNLSDGIGVYKNSRGSIPWTNGFDEYFLEKRGYQILDYLPLLFFDGDMSFKVRHDYWHTLMERFSEAYSKQIGEWCEANGLKLCGHYLHENELWAATKLCGAMMPHYRYMHIPGIDILGHHTDEYLTVKQCTSVANQYGRKKVISEMYGCTGWDFTFEGQKWIGDWQYVSGVNLRCQHLGLYSLKGCRKRDYPPSFNYNTPWWKYNKIVEDYFARIAAVLNYGAVQRDVLVLHPSSSVWSRMSWYMKKDETSKPRDCLINEILYSQRINDFAKYLLGLHYDFDFGDETIMKETGRVENGKLKVNLAQYSVVVIPAITTMFQSTFDLLMDFVNSGGKLIVVEPLPYMIEGEASDKLNDLFSNKNVLKADSDDRVGPLLESILSRKVSIKTRYNNEATELLCTLRDSKEFKSLFVINNNLHQSYEVNIRVDFSCKVEEWDSLTGDVKKVKVQADGVGMCFPATFGLADSRLYIFKKYEKPLYYSANEIIRRESDKPKRLITGLGPECSFTRTAPNALILDKCSFRLNGGDWSEQIEVWQAQRRVRHELGMMQIYTNRLKQRYEWVDIPHEKDGTPVEFKFVFEVKDVPSVPVYLVLETAEKYRISLNGADVLNTPDGWFLDRTFEKIQLPPLKQGTNELILWCAYENRMEVEDCYIIGDFGVNAQRSIVKEPPALHFGDWCLQGYFHYCGSIVYHFDFEYKETDEEGVILELGEYSAVTIEVRVNGETAGHIPWRAANGLDIRKWLKPGCNEIDIEVMGSPRNLLGPLHQAANSYDWVEADSFRREGCEYTPSYIVKPYGLFGQINVFGRK